MSGAGASPLIETLVMGNARRRSGGLLQDLAPPTLDSHEVRNCDKNNANHYDKNGSCHEIGKNHEGETADKRNDTLLIPTVHEEAEPNRPKQQTPQKQ